MLSAFFTIKMSSISKKLANTPYGLERAKEVTLGDKPDNTDSLQGSKANPCTLSQIPNPKLSYRRYLEGINALIERARRNCICCRLEWFVINIIISEHRLETVRSRGKKGCSHTWNT